MRVKIGDSVPRIPKVRPAHAPQWAGRYQPRRCGRLLVSNPLAPAATALAQAEARLAGGRRTVYRLPTCQAWNDPGCSPQGASRGRMMQSRRCRWDGR